MALEKIKELVNSPQILKPWDHFSEAPKYLVCDTSDIGLGSWIGQGELGSIQPCRFHSRKFSPAQLKYPTYQKQLLAIVDSLKFFKAPARGQQVHGSHGSPTTTLIPPAMTNISEASSLASLHARIRLGYRTYGWKRKLVGRRSIDIA